MTTDDLHARAAVIFGTARGGVAWPYGLETPNRWRLRNHPELYERLRREQLVRQQTIVTWAERYGLKASPSRALCCPRWLQRAASRHCDYRTTRCVGLGGWLDHGIGWLKDSRPAVITAAPYTGFAFHLKELEWWCGQAPFLRVAGGPGWYGYKTEQILMWRPDRVPVLTAAVICEELR